MKICETSKCHNFLTKWGKKPHIVVQILGTGAETVGPLYGLTGKHEFRWEAEHQSAFDKVKSLMTSAPVLTLPNPVDPFILDTDNRCVRNSNRR